MKAHRHEGSPLGKAVYTAIKRQQPPVGQSAVWPQVPEGMVLRDSLARVSGAGRELHTRKRPEYCDALDGIRDPNEAEMSDAMHFLCGLNAQNKTHRPHVKRVMMWISAQIGTFPVHVQCVAHQIDTGCLRVLRFFL